MLGAAAMTLHIQGVSKTFPMDADVERSLRTRAAEATRPSDIPIREHADEWTVREFSSGLNS
jgi:hypothetical protein